VAEALILALAVSQHGKCSATLKQIPCPARILPDFSQFRNNAKQAATPTSFTEDHGNPRLARFLREML
jgi:hypothetical protein